MWSPGRIFKFIVSSCNLMINLDLLNEYLYDGAAWSNKTIINRQHRCVGAL